MIFNCTSGRSGNTFLSAMLSKATEQLKKYGHDGDAGKLFDQVIFCANVTYADGGFKGGKSSSVETIAEYRTATDTEHVDRPDHARDPRVGPDPPQDTE